MSKEKVAPEQRCSICKEPISRVGPLAGNKQVILCRMCLERCLAEFDEETPSQATTEIQVSTPKQLHQFLGQYIIAQEEAKKTLSVAAYNHYKRILHRSPSVEIEKSNILLVGSTGCGKTLAARTLARKLDVPFAIGDATTLTEAGYVGEDVENLLLKLLRAADFDIKAAEHGIIYIDEIDKIGRTTHNVSITRDVSGEGVQQALLKMIEGTVANVPPEGGRKHPDQSYVRIDTTNILFICGGTFSGIHDVVAKRLHTKQIGFGNTASVQEETNKIEELRKQVNQTDLIEYGLIPEFVGRLPVIVHMHELHEEDLVRVLSEPKNSLTSQYQELFKIDGTHLEFTAESLHAIAAQAVKTQAGARGLRAIIEKLMRDVMFELPELKLKNFTVTEGMVTGAEPLFQEKKAA